VSEAPGIPFIFVSGTIGERRLGERVAQTVAWSGTGAEDGRDARFSMTTGQGQDSSVVARALRTGDLVLCMDIDQYRGALTECERAATQPGSAFICVPLFAADEPAGTLTVGAMRRASISEREIVLLERIGTEISAALLTPSISGARCWIR
jgi:GAF domain-containing protein